MSSSLKQEYKTAIQQDIVDSTTGVMRRANNVSHYQKIFQVCTAQNCKQCTAVQFSQSFPVGSADLGGNSSPTLVPLYRELGHCVTLNGICSLEPFILKALSSVINQSETTFATAFFIPELRAR